MEEDFTVRVTVVGSGAKGELVAGTVVVNVHGNCSADLAVEVAREWVNSGGFRWGPHGSGPTEVDTAELESIEYGLSGNPSTSINCG